MRGMLSAFSLAFSFGTLLWPLTAFAGQNDCPNGDPPRGCVEACRLPTDVDGQASTAFVAKLRSIAQSAHHIDTVFGSALLERLSSFRVVAVMLTEGDRRQWQQEGRWAGPCTGLRAVFHSKAVEDGNAKNVVDLYELQYRTAAEAQRVATSLDKSWDWNYHPFVPLQAGTSVIVLEGRHRAWDALGRVAAHFGASREALQRALRQRHTKTKAEAEEKAIHFGP